jgi:hypothetical protein
VPQTSRLTMMVVMSHFSRAWLHRACREYMAEPSAWRLMTRRPGHARAAPRAMGGPLPIAPPVRVKWEKGGQPCRCRQVGTQVQAGGYAAITIFG